MRHSVDGNNVLGFVLALFHVHIYNFSLISRVSLEGQFNGYILIINTTAIMSFVHPNFDLHFTSLVCCLFSSLPAVK